MELMQPNKPDRQVEPPLRITATLFMENSQHLVAAICYAELVKEHPDNPLFWCRLGSALGALGDAAVFVRKRFHRWAIRVFRRGLLLAENTNYQAIMHEWVDGITEVDTTTLEPIADEEIDALLDFLVIDDAIFAKAIGALPASDQPFVVMALGDRPTTTFLPVLIAAIEGQFGEMAARSALKRAHPHRNDPRLRVALERVAHTPRADQLEPYLSFAAEAVNGASDILPSAARVFLKHGQGLPAAVCFTVAIRNDTIESPELLAGLGAACAGGAGGVSEREPLFRWAGRALLRCLEVAGGELAEVADEQLRAVRAELDVDSLTPLTAEDLPELLGFLDVDDTYLVNAIDAIPEDQRMFLIMALGDCPEDAFAPALQEAMRGRWGAPAARSALKRAPYWWERQWVQGAVLTLATSPLSDECQPYLSWTMNAMFVPAPVPPPVPPPVPANEFWYWIIGGVTVGLLFTVL